MADKKLTEEQIRQAAESATKDFFGGGVTQQQPTKNKSAYDLNQRIDMDAAKAAEDFLNPTNSKSQGEIELSRNPDMGADFQTALQAGVPTNQSGAIKIFAKKRGIPESRYKVINGEIAYQADDGKYYPEIPDFFDRPMSKIGYYAPDVLEATADATAAALAVPTGGLGVPVASSVAFEANALRQLLAQKLGGGNPNISDSLISGVGGGLGQSIPMAYRAVKQRGLLDNIDKLYKEGTSEFSDAIKALQDKAASYGINLTPAELTGNPKLAAKQKVLGNIEESSEKMKGFYKKRYEQEVQPAVKNFLDTLSLSDDATEVGGMAQKSLIAARQSLESARKKATEPLYKKAFENAPDVDVSPAVSRIDALLQNASATERRALQRVRDELVETKKVKDLSGKEVSTQSLIKNPKRLQRSLFEIDALIKSDESLNSLNKVVGSEIVELRQLLKSQMSKDNPAYAEADSVFSRMSEPLEEFDTRKTGLSLTKISPDNLNNFTQRLFETASPSSIGYAKQQIKSQNPEVWDAVVRNHLENAWTKATAASKNATEVNFDAGLSWKNILLGDEKKAATLRAALTPEQYTALGNLSEVLEAAGKVKKIGSDTAYNAKIIEELQKNPPITGAGTGAIRAGAAIGEFWTIPKKLGDWARSKDAARNVDAYIDIITSKDGINRLKELRKMSPSSFKRMAGLAQLGVQYGFIGQNKDVDNIQLDPITVTP